jgi:Domain of unknown function (DUF5659)
MGHQDFYENAVLGLEAEGDTFWTRDIALAAALTVYGHRIGGIQVEETGERYEVKWFGFPKTAELAGHVEDYFHDRLVGSFRQYYMAFRQVKGHLATKVA